MDRRLPAVMAVAIACLAVCVVSVRAGAAPLRSSTRVVPRVPEVVMENRRPGTPGWLGPLATDRAIELYAGVTRRVSFDRPYAWYGPGGQGPLGWELPLVRYIERNGWDVSYQTDVATDARPASLLRHRLVVVAGHSEYWSRTMRDAFNAARDKGVNLASTSRSWARTMRTGGCVWKTRAER